MKRRKKIPHTGDHWISQWVHQFQKLAPAKKILKTYIYNYMGNVFLLRVCWRFDKENNILEPFPELWWFNQHPWILPIVLMIYPVIIPIPSLVLLWFNKHHQAFPRVVLVLPASLHLPIICADINLKLLYGFDDVPNNP